MSHRALPSAGFTLIEMMLVMVVLAILSAAILPSGDPTIHEQLQSATRVLAADLAYARSLAVANNSQYQVEFLADNTYEFTHTGANSALNTLPKRTFDTPGGPPNVRVVRFDDLPQLRLSVQIAAVHAMTPAPQDVDEVEFGPQGETTRSEETVVWLTAGEDSSARYLAVRVNPVTGLTKIDSFSSTPPPASTP